MTEMECPITGYQKLLLATDGSRYNEGAVREAIKLTERCGSKLYAIAVVQTNAEYMAAAPERVEESEKEARKSLEAVKARAGEKSVACELIVHEGEQPYQFIVKEAEKNNISTIIMGRRGRSGLKKLVMGSVTARVIGHAPCNILVVPREAIVDCRSILVATDGSQDSEAAAKEAIDIAKGCQGKLTVLSAVVADSVREFGEENVKKVEAMAAAEGLGAQAIVAKGPAADTITGTAKEIGSDLIVVGSHGRTGLQRLLMGSVTEGVIGHSDCSVLVTRPQV